MAKIVCIAEGTLRPGVNEIGDIVSIYDDGVVLGDGYNGFEIVCVPCVTAKQVEISVQKFKTNLVKAFKCKSSNWQIERPEEMNVWVDDSGKWHEFKVIPKYLASLPILKSDINREIFKKDISCCADNIEALELLETNLFDKSKDIPENFIEVSELNGN